jgi:hypothetical protein
MIKPILLLAAALGLIAQSSVFAADPTPAPSPEKAAATEAASPSKSPAKKTTRRRARVQERRKARKEPKAPSTEAKPMPSATPKQ